MAARKKQIEIKNRYSGDIIVSGKYVNLREAVEKNKAHLSRADLSGANLFGADLSGADLSGADLSGADLSGADLSGADLSGAYLSRANLYGAHLSGAHLYGANLSGANLSEANLSGANLYGAYLSGAHLYGAHLSGANLSGAICDEPVFLCDLYSLKLQLPSTKLRFWKYLTNGKSPYQNFDYEVGKMYTFDDLDYDEQILCAPGGNVATLPWCLKDNTGADEFIEVEFRAGDIVMPWLSDGKFRVAKFKVLRKINRKQAIALLKKAMAQGRKD